MTFIKHSASSCVAICLLASSLACAQTAPPTPHSQPKIAEADARVTALARVPHGSIASSELEQEHGKLVWSFDITRPGTKNVTEIQVDARNGKIVSEKIETPAQEKQEARTEKR